MSDPTARGTIAVTGASGELGRRVAARLVALGVTPRLVVRDAVRDPQIAGTDVRVAPAYGASEAMRTALEGADAVFLISARESSDRVAQHVAAIDAAAAAGVRHIVYLSFLGAAPDATFTFARDHWATEQHIRATAMPFTILRPSMYLDQIPEWVAPEGVLRGPADDGRVGAVARDDLADVAAAVLAGDGHAGRTYDVTGREAFTFTEAAALITRASGRDVIFVDETLDEARAARAALGEPWEVEGWITSFAAVAAGELEKVSETVRRFAGHEPITLGEYLERHPESWAHLR